MSEFFNEYTFTMNHNNEIENTLTGRADGIVDMLEDFKQFLLGCGFHNKNVDSIQFVDEE